MKKYSLKLLVLLAIVLLGVFAVAGAVMPQCPECGADIMTPAHGNAVDIQICDECKIDVDRNVHTDDYKDCPTCNGCEQPNCDGVYNYQYKNDNGELFRVICYKCYDVKETYENRTSCQYDDESGKHTFQIKNIALKEVIEEFDSQFGFYGNVTGHVVPLCFCYTDEAGRQHDEVDTPEECAACLSIRENQSNGSEGGNDEPEEPACTHKTLTHKYYTWLNAERHLAEATCPDCDSTVRGNEPHSYNPNWHNGTVCQYCKKDADEVAHNWSNGACSVCEEGKPAPEPTPIPDGLNPDDGWHYENGEKSDFTGLCEYDGGLFYIKNGQWQKDLNGLKLIGEEFWYLANGQVQEHHGFAEYDGEWFYLDGGKLDVTASGVFQYDGEWFLVAAGRLVSEHTGFAQLPTGEWYYIAEGRMLKEFTGEVEYDGKVFSIINGKIVA